MSIKKAIGGSLGAIIILFIVQILAHIIGDLLVQLEVPEGFCNIIRGILYLFFGYILLKVLATKILKINMEKLSIPKFRIDGKWIAVAFALPVMVTVIYFFLPGKLVSSEMNGSQLFAALSAGIFFAGMAAGFVEEMVFRGFILNLFKMKWGSTIAIIVPSVLFGAIHIIGMEFSLFNCFLVIVAGTLGGIMFSFIALENHSVWNSGIVHCLWNIITGTLVKISDAPASSSIMTYVLDSNHFAITGGEFGIESSIIAACGFVFVTLFAIFMKKRKNKILSS